MKRNALITVSAKARYTGAGREKTIYTVNGTMEEAGAGWRVSYAEPEDSGMAGTVTMLDITRKSVELTRAGSVHHYLIFTQGLPFSSVYETPQGKFNTEIHTGSLRARFGGHGGLLEIKYDMELGGAASERELVVRVKTLEGGDGT